MYVKVYHRYQNEWEASSVLELTRAQLKQLKRERPGRLYLVITGAEAHRWVRDGGVHGTALYIDQDKRIRRNG